MAAHQQPICVLKGVPFLTLLTHIVFNLTGKFSSCLSLIREAKEKDDAMIKAINLIFFHLQSSISTLSESYQMFTFEIVYNVKWLLHTHS